MLIVHPTKNRSKKMKKHEETVIGSLAIRYSKNPGIKALIKLIPGGSSVDSLLSSRADEVKRERLRVFFDELAKGNANITPELVNSDDFLHCYFKTVQAATNTRRNEKIEMFARMLTATLNAESFTGLDQYEELLDILDSTSYRELAVLTTLKEFEDAHAADDFQNEAMRIMSYWKKFKENVCKGFAIEVEEFDPFMERLQRTSLFSPNTQSFYGDGPGIGQTTRQFSKLCALIGNNSKSMQQP